MRFWPELLAGFQIVCATLLLVGAPPLLMLGPERLDLSEDQFAAGSAFFGVVLGALLSVFVQGHFSRQQDRDRRLGVGHSVFFKVLRYASDAEQVCRHVEKHRPSKGRAIAWRTIQPLLMPTVSTAAFTPGELALFAVGGRSGFADKLMDFASVHNHLVSLNENYRQRQEALARARLENRVAGRSDDDLAVDEDIVIQLAERLLVLTREAQPLIEEVAGSIGNQLNEVLDDARFRVQLARRR